MKMIIAVFALAAMFSLADAASFTKEGMAGSGGYGYNYVVGVRDDLMPDGSFEAGCGAYWACETDNSCTWIVDLVPLGLWNFDGDMVAWLGGFCGGWATCQTEICQTVYINAHYLLWWWIAYVNDSVGLNYVTVGGDVVYSHVLQSNEHLLDYQQEGISLEGYSGDTHEICFGVDNNANCASNFGDNWFVDYVELFLHVAAEEASFSTVKALY